MPGVTDVVVVVVVVVGWPSAVSTQVEPFLVIVDEKILSLATADPSALIELHSRGPGFWYGEEVREPDQDCFPSICCPFCDDAVSRSPDRSGRVDWAAFLAC
jgi:hypothetical protein